MSTLTRDINFWQILGRDYHQGIALLNKYSKEVYLVNLFQKNDNDYFRKRLSKEIDQLFTRLNGVVSIKEQDPDDEPVRDVLQEMRTWLNRSESHHGYLSNGVRDVPGHQSYGSKMYDQGLALFSELGDDVTQVKLLRKSNGDTFRMKLRDEMEKLYARLKATEKKQEEPPDAVPAPVRTLADEFISWFNEDRNYYWGIALFSELSEDAERVAYFRKFDSEYSRQRLNGEMDKLYDKLKGKPQHVYADAVTADPDQINVPSSERKVKNPELEQACEQKAGQLFKSMMNDRAVLFNQTKVEDWDDINKPELVEQRRQLALQVCAANYEVSQAYDDLEHVRQHGTLPDNGEADQEDPELQNLDLKPAIDNLRKNISKLRQKEQTPERVAMIQSHEVKLKTLLDRWNQVRQAD